MMAKRCHICMSKIELRSLYEAPYMLKEKGQTTFIHKNENKYAIISKKNNRISRKYEFKD